MRRLLIRLWQLVVVWRESVVVYTYNPRQGHGMRDERIQIVDRGVAVPRSVKTEFRRARGARLWWVMRYRMIVRGAKLLYLSEEGELWAYGWVQRCDPFLRRYRWLTPRGTLLGYFWTAPARRGLGLYGRLLDHCIAICEDREEVPLIVYADVTNHSSRRGLEKAGFTRLGEYRVTSRLLGLVCTHKVISQERTIREVLAGV
jgi:GNAT superfamily N-acetyltransferase